MINFALVLSAAVFCIYITLFSSNFQPRFQQYLGLEMRYFTLLLATTALFASAQEVTPVSQSAAVPSDSPQCASQQ
jgi:hypothetical protein